jgi:hypothetical protein
VQPALAGSRYGDWGTNPVVWWGELAIAACSVLTTVVVAIAVGRWDERGDASNGKVGLAAGLGFLGLGCLGIAAGWLGFQVPTTPGYDVLSRGEFIIIIFGVAALAFGGLVTIVALVALELSPDRGVGFVAGWRVVRSRELPPSISGQVAGFAIEGEQLIVIGPRGERLASFGVADMRLEAIGDGTYRLLEGDAEIAELEPVGPDSEALVAALATAR